MKIFTFSNILQENPLAKLENCEFWLKRGAQVNAKNPQVSQIKKIHALSVAAWQ
jgi:hypothetical protein